MLIKNINIYQIYACIKYEHVQKCIKHFFSSNVALLVDLKVSFLNHNLESIGIFTIVKMLFKCGSGQWIITQKDTLCC